MPTVFEELTGSPEIEFGLSGITATRRFLVDWPQRYDLAAELFGTRGVISPTEPQVFPGFPRCLLSSVRVQPFGGEDAPASGGGTLADLPAYEKALLTVTYATREFSPQQAEAVQQQHPYLPNVPEGSFLSYRASGGGQFLQIPGRGLNWSDDSSLPVPEDALGTIFVPVTEHRLTWHKCPQPPWSAIRNQQGKVNAAEFMNFEPETLLFADWKAQIELEFDPDQQFTWRLDYTFRQRRIDDGSGAAGIHGWNHTYRAQHPAGWNKLADQANGNSLYLTTSFDSLFAFPANPLQP